MGNSKEANLKSSIAKNMREFTGDREKLNKTTKFRISNEEEWTPQ
jgi:hypothetical protein